MIPKRQTEIVTSEDRKDHNQQNETKDKQRKHNTTQKTKARLSRTLQKPGRVQVLCSHDIWKISIVICEIDISYRSNK